MDALHTIWGKNYKNLLTLNSAYITLIPKNTEVDRVKDVRPISLVHIFAKLVTKVLSNRLAGRLDGMVSPNQSTFIKKNSCRITSRWSTNLKILALPKIAKVMLKWDITKTFDSIS